MGKKKIPAGAVTVVMVIELVEVQGPNGSGFGVMLSRAGSDDVVERFWPEVQGRIDEPQLRDIAATVAGSVVLAAETWTGVQGVLPMV